MFVDHVRLKLIAGRGGHGVVAWKRERYLPKGGACGGNGGRGGSIVCKADPQLTSLSDFRHQTQLIANNGGSGGNDRCQGGKGKDLVLRIPCGTLVRESDSGKVIHDFVDPYEERYICRGGKGGMGNAFFRTATRQAPNRRTEGQLGESKRIDLELKLVADIGLVGFPNAGKTTLLSQLAGLSLRTAPYPFTTKIPHLGVLEFEDFSRACLADIPGIIEGASQNRGLGLSFLKHIERCVALIYVIDLSAADGRDPIEDLALLRHEIEMYSPKVVEKPFCVVLNKMDVEGTERQIHPFYGRYPDCRKRLFPVSASQRQGLFPLKQRIYALKRSMRDGQSQN